MTATTEPRRVTLGADIVGFLVTGMTRLTEADGLTDENRDAIVAMLWNADLVLLVVGADMGTSLAARATHREGDE